MNATPQARKALASRSHAYNVSQLQFRKVFPEYVEDRENPKDLPNMDSSGASSSQKAAAQAAGTAASSLPLKRE